jgi:hypothetical protein
MVQQLWHHCTNHAAMQNLLVHGAQPVITTKSQEYTQVTWLSAQAYSQTNIHGHRKLQGLIGPA